MTLDAASSVLLPDAIFLGRSGDTMEAAIEFVGGELVRRGIVGEGYIAGMKKREESVSTYLGNGVALPHGTFETKDEVKGTAIVIAQYPEGVLWGEETAHLVIGLAATGEDHVNVLSALAEVLQDEDLCERLWVTDDAELVYDTLANAALEDDEDEDTVRVDVTITNPAGLHARPASMLVERAQRFEGDISIVKGSKSANAKSIMSVLSLGASTGDSVTVTAVGPGADEVVEQVIEIMRQEESA